MALGRREFIGTAGIAGIGITSVRQASYRRVTSLPIPKEGGIAPMHVRLPEFGLNMEPWHSVNPAPHVWRGYNGAGIPGQWPGPLYGNKIPAQTRAIVSSAVEPQVNDIIAGVYDKQITAFAKTVPFAQLFTFCHEGELSNHNLTPAQVSGLHTRAHSLFKAANPFCLYGQIMASYEFEQHLSYIIPGLDFYGMDAYPKTKDEAPFTTFGEMHHTLRAYGPTFIAEYGSRGAQYQFPPNGPLYVQAWELAQNLRLPIFAAFQLHSIAFSAEELNAMHLISLQSEQA